MPSSSAQPEGRHSGTGCSMDGHRGQHAQEKLFTVTKGPHYRILLLWHTYDSKNHTTGMRGAGWGDRGGRDAGELLCDRHRVSALQDEMSHGNGRRWQRTAWTHLIPWTEYLKMVTVAILHYVCFTTRKALETIHWEIFGFVFLFFKLRTSWEYLSEGAIPIEGSVMVPKMCWSRKKDCVKYLYTSHLSFWCLNLWYESGLTLGLCCLYAIAGKV